MDSLAVFGNAIISTVSGYLNFGETVGSTGYGLRDNNGTMEFKNSGGTWASLNNVIQNYLTLNNYTPGGWRRRGSGMELNHRHSRWIRGRSGQHRGNYIVPDMHVQR
jgi:hypothetical protein